MKATSASIIVTTTNPTTNHNHVQLPTLIIINTSTTTSTMIPSNTTMTSPSKTKQLATGRFEMMKMKMADDLRERHNWMSGVVSEDGQGCMGVVEKLKAIVADLININASDHRIIRKLGRLQEHADRIKHFQQANRFKLADSSISVIEENNREFVIDDYSFQNRVAQTLPRTADCAFHLSPGFHFGPRVSSASSEDILGESESATSEKDINDLALLGAPSLNLSPISPLNMSFEKVLHKSTAITNLINAGTTTATRVINNADDGVGDVCVDGAGSGVGSARKINVNASDEPILTRKSYSTIANKITSPQKIKVITTTTSTTLATTISVTTTAPMTSSTSITSAVSTLTITTTTSASTTPVSATVKYEVNPNPDNPNINVNISTNVSATDSATTVNSTAPKQFLVQNKPNSDPIDNHIIINKINSKIPTITNNSNNNINNNKNIISSNINNNRNINNFTRNNTANNTKILFSNPSVVGNISNKQEAIKPTTTSFIRHTTKTTTETKTTSPLSLLSSTKSISSMSSTSPTSTIASSSAAAATAKKASKYDDLSALKLTPQKSLVQQQPTTTQYQSTTTIQPATTQHQSTTTIQPATTQHQSTTTIQPATTQAMQHLLRHQEPKPQQQSKIKSLSRIFESFSSDANNNKANNNNNDDNNNIDIDNNANDFNSNSFNRKSNRKFYSGSTANKKQ